MCLSCFSAASPLRIMCVSSVSPVLILLNRRKSMLSFSMFHRGGMFSLLCIVVSIVVSLPLFPFLYSLIPAPGPRILCVSVAASPGLSVFLLSILLLKKNVSFSLPSCSLLVSHPLLLLCFSSASPVFLLCLHCFSPDSPLLLLSLLVFLCFSCIFLCLFCFSSVSRVSLQFSSASRIFLLSSLLLLSCSCVCPGSPLLLLCFSSASPVVLLLDRRTYSFVFPSASLGLTRNSQRQRRD